MKTKETITARAYQLWEAAGCPDGRAEEFWLRAERELKAEVIPPAPPPLIPQSPSHIVPPVIRAVVQPVARPPKPAPSRKRQAR